MVLHNICIDMGDAPESIIDFNPHDEFLSLDMKEDMGN